VLCALELHQISRHGGAGNFGEIETGPRMQHHFQRSREVEYVVLCVVFTLMAGNV
jgi:hypothetical protein